MLMYAFLSQIRPACLDDVNEMKPKSNFKMTDKQTIACIEFSKNCVSEHILCVRYELTIHTTI